MLTAQEILDLNKDAFNLLFDMIKEQIFDKGNIFLESKCRDGYLEYYFNDGTFIEIAVVRDFNDNMNPTHVVLNEYVKVKGHHGFTIRYDRLYTERFKVS